MPFLAPILSFLSSTVGRVIAIAGLAAAVSTGTFFYGLHLGNQKSDAAIAKFEAVKDKITNNAQQGSAKATDKVVTEYVDRVKRVHDKEYVYNSTDVPSQYNLSQGWIYLHDQAAKGDDANKLLAMSPTPSLFKDSQIIKTVTHNYSTCHETEEQLKSLQSWITEQQKAVAAANKGK